MNTVEVINYINSKEFNLMDIELGDRSTYVFFTKEQINLVICKYQNMDEINGIDTAALEIRMKLIKNKINVWNTYMIIVFEDAINIEDAYLIEKNAKAMRKYVIRNFDDFKRIPFLDDTEVEIGAMSITDKILTNYESQELENVMNFIKENDGGNVKLKPSYINKSMHTLFELEEANYEN